MGQEASLPQVDGEDFEEQARAPPSSINPPVAPGTPVRPGSKMINTIMHRATAGAGHQDFESKESSRTVPRPGQVPYGASHYGNGGPGIQQSPISGYPSLNQMTPEEQHIYFQQQKAAMAQNQRHQDTQNMMHHDAQYQHYGSHPQGPSHPPAANVNAGVGPGGLYASTMGRKGGRGKALINSMKNLSIGNTIRSGVQATANVAAATASAAVATAAAVNANVKAKSGGVSEWEARWDEDDDSDGEDETDTKHPAMAHPGAPPMHHSASQQMDAGHASFSPASRAVGLMDPTIQAMTPTKSLPGRSNVVTPLRGDQSGVDDDGVEWDTGAQQELSAKPNVQMFLPLLRVLGKGSFGKVR
jgi:ribosomal protein L12E/L44/L45/RPP1/RPP2